MNTSETTYTYVPDFIVYTDINPLTFVLTTAKLNATGHRWVSELADFSFTIKYRPGHANKDADALSRLPMDIDSYMKLCTENMSESDIKACRSIRTRRDNLGVCSKQ